MRTDQLLTAAEAVFLKRCIWTPRAITAKIIKGFVSPFTVQPTRNKHISRSAESMCNKSMLSRPLKPRQYVAARRDASHLSAEPCQGKPRSTIRRRVHAHHKIKIF
ncbi:hypothetical protein DPMN_174396 [Dreissena polymorpha]|uniref:Uncharacterized protein n=1 Tax=Dreissena polymorpha TaxID=45954 RepID=A0A9D4IHU3_DREPO|nr:hypothetical protein DPMN_174396 [Dreissena polymorpha]